MAHPRKKKRTHLGVRGGRTNSASVKPASKEPKSMVIRIGAGEIGASASQLVRDVRNIMEPGTASRLKERRANKLRDYTAMAGPLGVSHLLLFSRSDSGNINLRIALTPRGPTLYFRVEQFSLAKDVRKAQRHPQGGPKDFLTAPLLVMNNFTLPAPTDGSQPAVPKHLEFLTTTVFQSLFPAISPQATPLSSIRRVLLLDRQLPKINLGVDYGSYILHLRHYAIATKRIGISRSLKRLNSAEKLIKQPTKRSRSMPNLGALNDIADLLLDPSAAIPGCTSPSESEMETDAEIEVLEIEPKKVLNKQQMAAKRMKDSKNSRRDTRQIEKRAIKLVELGPRMRLRMTKIEEGVCEGKVMWHEYLNKTPEEVTQMQRVWDSKRERKEQRRRLQKENVERKKRGERTDSKDGGEEERLDAVDTEGDGWDSETTEGDKDVEMEVDDADAVFVG
ncbi:MAG: hypothetical protein Q9163_003935 [Psora crenata]